MQVYTTYKEALREAKNQASEYNQCAYIIPMTYQIGFAVKLDCQYVGAATSIVHPDGMIYGG